MSASRPGLVTMNEDGAESSGQITTADSTHGVQLSAFMASSRASGVERRSSAPGVVWK